MEFTIVVTQHFVFHHQSRAFLEPLEIFKGEVEETIEKVEMARKILKHFRDTYEHHRLHIRDYFKEKEPRSWEFAPQLVFHRFDKFVERVEMVHVSRFVCFVDIICGTMND